MEAFYPILKAFRAWVDAILEFRLRLCHHVGNPLNSAIEAPFWLWEREILPSNVIFLTQDVQGGEIICVR